MTSYKGKFADMYDLFYAEKDYKAEAAYVHKWLNKFGSKKITSILEVACGTGNHSFQLEKLGYDIFAIDSSSDMLERALIKARRIKSTAEFTVADMRNLSQYRKKFEGGVCLFDSIGYALTNEAIIDTLTGIRKNLMNNALFILEFWHAAAMVKHYEKRRIREVETEDGTRYVRTSETEVDYIRQQCTVRYKIRDHRNRLIHSERHKNRFFLVQEMALFLSQSGFLPLKFFNGFSNDQNIDEHSWHIVAVARCK